MSGSRPYAAQEAEEITERFRVVSSETILLLEVIFFHFVSDSNANLSCTFINFHSGNGTGRHHFYTVRRITAKNGMADQTAQSGSTFPAVLHNFHRHRIGKGGG